MNKLNIKCVASPETNDHQASILVDGVDWLGDDYLGLDPPRLFQQETLLCGGRTIVGRCNCGCEGCDDVVVDIIINENVVKWQSPKGYVLTFNRSEYESEISTKSSDFSWEDSNRTAERLVNGVFDSTLLPGGWKYDWSSARMGKGKISLSFTLNDQQKLIEFGWDSEDPLTAEKRARQLKREMENE